MSFEEYGLSPELLSGLTDVQIDTPSPLQQQVLPAALEGKNLLVRSESGDIVSFLIPTLKTLVEYGEKEGTKVLILTPSIERAAAIDELIWAAGYHAQISSALLAIKGNKEEQEQAVLDGAPVIVANPGRFIEIIEKNNFQLKELKLIVIDEAHDMENFNLVSRVKDILRFVEGEPQTLVLSKQRNTATEELVKIALQNPELIGFELSESSESVAEPKTNGAAKKNEVKETEPVDVDLDDAKKKLDGASIKVVLKKDLKEEAPSSEEPAQKPTPTPSKKKGKQGKSKLSAKEHGYINVPPRMKISTLMAHLEESTSKKVLVFSASKRTADRLFHILKKKSWGVVSISSDLDKEMYDERYNKFAVGEMRVCVVGGMSISEVEVKQPIDEIINYDVPENVEEYRSRIEMVQQNQASRMISLVSKMDKEDLARISEETSYSPGEIPLPNQVKEKKKGNKSGSKKRSTGKKPQHQKKKANKPPRKKVKPNELPRPTYDGLSGGRDGDANSKGVFGWVKKLFN